MFSIHVSTADREIKRKIKTETKIENIIKE
jgi:hypothetical protein